MRLVLLVAAIALLGACEMPYDPNYEHGDPLPSNLGTFKITSISETTVLLSWNDRSNIETKYVVQKKDEEYTNWTELAILLPNTEEYYDNTLNTSLDYYYRVAAATERHYSWTYWQRISFVDGQWQVTETQSP